VRHLILASRSGTASEDLLAELSEVDVRVVACDVADPTQVTDLIDAIPAAHPLTAVVHSAGVLDDGTLEGLTPERVGAVFGPKVFGAWNLHQATRHHDLAAFILYSAGAGTFGSAGQANYAAANTFLDALAHHRRAAGLPAQSVAWGLWAAPSGMTGHLEKKALSRLAKTGMIALSPADGMALFDQSQRRPEGHLVALRLEPTPEARRGPTAAPVAAPPSLVDELVAMPTTQRQATLLKIVRTHAATVLGHPDAASVGEDEQFQSLGLDSLTAVELRNRLNHATGIRLPATAAFDHPTPTQLAQHLHTMLPLPADPDPTTDTMAEPAALIDADKASDAELFDFIDNNLTRA